MKPLKNIEFFADPTYHGVMFRDDDGVKTLKSEDVDVVCHLFSLIEEWYPDAFRALGQWYARSAANVPYFRFLVVQRFLLCNFSELDSRLDIDECGRFHFEAVRCPMANECQYHGIVCSPVRSTELTARQREVMRLYCSGSSFEDISLALYISVETAKTIKRNAFTKAGVSDIREFMSKYKDFM